MGNRAVITTAPFDEANVGIYVHWNGGQESIEGFLRACKKLGYRSPETDCYGMARLTQAIGVFFGGELSLGIDTVRNLDCDNGDNGVWLIGDNWQIVGHTNGKAGHKPIKLGKLGEAGKDKAAEICDVIVGKTRAAEAFELKPRVEIPED
jgi:hypothetical protein